MCNHYGVGLAPWNIKLVEYFAENNGTPEIRVLKTGKVFPVVLFHFENVAFLTKHVLHASSRTKSTALHSAIYVPYIKRLIENRTYLEEKYGIRLSRERRVVTKNPLMRLYQKYVSPFKRVTHRRDLFWVK